MKPLCFDLFTGIHGWAEGFLSEGWRVVGFDLYDMCRQVGVPAPRGNFQLVLQDILTVHGSQFRHADCIVASPPCQAYSYMAMPWSRAKREIRWQQWERDSPFGNFRLNDLFNACFRIQRQASEAAGRHIPMVVENVKGAQPWVGRAAWHFGSFYLWGDVPAIMPHTMKLRKVPGFNFHQHENGQPGGSFQSAAVAGMKTVGHANIRDGHSHTRHLTNQRESEGLKGPGGDWFANGRQGQDACVAGIKQHGSGPEWFDKALDERRKQATATKVGGDWFGSYAEQKAAGTISPGRLHGKRSDSRKAASAMIAKIPGELSQYIARYYKP